MTYWEWGTQVPGDAVQRPKTSTSLLVPMYTLLLKMVGVGKFTAFPTELPKLLLSTACCGTERYGQARSVSRGDSTQCKRLR